MAGGSRCRSDTDDGAEVITSCSQEVMTSLELQKVFLVFTSPCSILNTDISDRNRNRILFRLQTVFPVSVVLVQHN